MVATYRTMARAYRGKRRTVRRKAPGKVRARRGSRTKSYGARKSGRITRLKTRTRQRVRNPDRQRVTPMYGQNITYIRKSYGKMRKLNFRKLETKAFATYIRRMQGVLRQNTAVVTRDAAGTIINTTTPGFYTLLHGPPTPDAPRPLPVHLWTLNDKLDSNYALGREMTIAPLGGGITWTNIQGSQLPSGIYRGETDWQDEYQNSAATLPENSLRYQRHCWYDMRMNLYGQTTCAVTYDVYLIRIMVDEVNPNAEEYDPNDGRTRAFWDGIYQPVAYNTLMPQPFGGTRGLVVIKHKRVVIEAASNDDLDASPQCVQLKWFYRDGRIYDYLNQPTSRDPNQIVNGGWALRGLVSNGEFTPNPQPKAQLMLMIRASNPAVDMNFDGHTQPSYDLILRRKTQAMI